MSAFGRGATVQRTVEGPADLDNLAFRVLRINPHLPPDVIIEEMISCDRDFYSMPRILRRVWGNLWHWRRPLITLVGSLSYRNNIRLNCRSYADFTRERGNRHD